MTPLKPKTAAQNVSRPRGMHSRVRRLAALALCLLLRTAAQAEIIFTDLGAGVTVTPGAIMDIDVNDSPMAGIGIGATRDFHLYFGFNDPNQPTLFPVGGSTTTRALATGGFVDLLTAGTVIGPPAGSFTAHGGNTNLATEPAGPWAGGANGFIGFHITDTDQYGYLHVDYNDAANSLTLLNFGVESHANTAILAGARPAANNVAVPEPSTFAFLGLGLASFGWWRRRRRQSPLRMD